MEIPVYLQGAAAEGEVEVEVEAAEAAEAAEVVEEAAEGAAKKNTRSDSFIHIIRIIYLPEGAAAEVEQEAEEGAAKSKKVVRLS